METTNSESFFVKMNLDMIHISRLIFSFVLTTQALHLNSQIQLNWILFSHDKWLKLNIFKSPASVRLLSPRCLERSVEPLISKQHTAEVTKPRRIIFSYMQESGAKVYLQKATCRKSLTICSNQRCKNRRWLASKFKPISLILMGIICSFQYDKCRS